MTDETLPGPEWIPAFLGALRVTGKIRPAAKAAGIAASTAHYQRRTNRLFAAACEAATAPPNSVAGTAQQDRTLRTRIWGWRNRFLEALAETSNVAASAARANVPAATVYKVRREDPEFAAKWLAALHEGYDHLEIELLGYLRDPAPGRKMDVNGALRLLAAHRETVERRRAMEDGRDDDAVFASIDAFLEGMRERRLANEAILLETKRDDDGE